MLIFILIHLSEMHRTERVEISVQRHGNQLRKSEIRITEEFSGLSGKEKGAYGTPFLTLPDKPAYAY